MPTTKIAKGIQEFRNEVYPRHEGLFRELEGGQQPEVLLITCSDSRIDPALVTQTLPGDLFVIRNAGNLVGRYDPAGDAQAGTIEYAVKALGVKHIVVCGHEHCGAMSAVLAPESLGELPAVEAWLRRSGPERVAGDSPTVAEQVRSNVIQQIDNLRTHPAVREAEGEGALSLHGWVYDFVSGEIRAFDRSRGTFAGLGTTGNVDASTNVTEEISS
jgi:carbonic anhydrase